MLAEMILFAQIDIFPFKWQITNKMNSSAQNHICALL